MKRPGFAEWTGEAKNRTCASPYPHVLFDRHVSPLNVRLPLDNVVVSGFMPCEQQVNFWQYSCLGSHEEKFPIENETFHRQRQEVEMHLEKNQSVSGSRIINSRADGKARGKSQKTHSLDSSLD